MSNFLLTFSIEVCYEFFFSKILEQNKGAQATGDWGDWVWTQK